MGNTTKNVKMFSGCFFSHFTEIRVQSQRHKAVIYEVMLTHVCHKFLCTATLIWPKALSLSLLPYRTSWTSWAACTGVTGGHYAAFCNIKILESFPTGSLFLLLFGHESSDRRKPALNHSWQWGNQLYWSLLFFKGPRPFLAGCHFRSLWCQPSVGFQVALLNPHFHF